VLNKQQAKNNKLFVAKSLYIEIIKKDKVSDTAAILLFRYSLSWFERTPPFMARDIALGKNLAILM
jgi:hypothetical protein